MNRVIGAALALLFVVAAGSFAAAAGESGSAAQSGINLALPGDPGNFDPATNWLHILAAQQFLTLVDWDYNRSEPIANAAESWTVSDDGRTYTFTLREGLAWSDGQPVTAADFEYSLQTIVDPDSATPFSYRAFIIENAAAVNAGERPVAALGVQAVDDLTLTITLTEPATWFLSSLSSMGHSVPRWAREEHGSDWVQPENIVVNGPYRLVEAVAEDRYVLERNDGYFDADNVAIPQITFFVVKDASTQLAMYEAGELDFIESIPPGALDRIREDSVLGPEYYNGPRFVVYYYFFNVSKPPFNQVLVRKAFAAALDKDTVTGRITRGGEVPAGTMTPPGSTGHVPNDAGIGIPYDPEQAKAWLAEAGYPNGEGLPEIELGFNASQLHQNIAQAIQKMWQDNLGATVSLRGVEGRAYSVNAAQGAHNVWRMGWGMDYPDAHNIHMEIFHGSVGQPATFKNPEYDRIIEEAAVERDLATRQQLYRIAERILVQEQAGVIPIYWYADNSLTKGHVDRPQTPQFMKLFKDWQIN